MESIASCLLLLGPQRAVVLEMWSMLWWESLKGPKSLNGGGAPESMPMSRKRHPERRWHVSAMVQLAWGFGGTTADLGWAQGSRLSGWQQFFEFNGIGTLISDPGSVSHPVTVSPLLSLSSLSLLLHEPFLGYCSLHYLFHLDQMSRELLECIMYMYVFLSSSLLPRPTLPMIFI